MSKEWAAWLAYVLASKLAPPKISGCNVQDHVDSLLARGDMNAWIVNLRQRHGGRSPQRYDDQGQQRVRQGQPSDSL